MAEIAPFAAHGFMAVARPAQKVAATLFLGLGRITQTGNKTLTGRLVFSITKKNALYAVSKTSLKSTILMKISKTTHQKT
jgi:hypothetical protein